MTTSLSAWWHRGVSREPLPRIWKVHFEKTALPSTFWCPWILCFRIKHPRYLFLLPTKHPISANMKSTLRPTWRNKWDWWNLLRSIHSCQDVLDGTRLHVKSCRKISQIDSNWIKLVFSVWGCARIHKNTTSSWVAEEIYWTSCLPDSCCKIHCLALGKNIKNICFTGN